MTGSKRTPWPSAATTVVGVMGDPIAHSLSPLLHNTAFAALGLDWISVGFSVRAGEGSAAGAVSGIRALGMAGVSVTMPHKSDVAMLVDERSETAELLGAVNCITRQADRLIGINTDGEGFLEALGRGANIDVLGLRCLVLGAGGAARAVVHALGVAGALEVAVWARRIERAEEVATLAGAAGRTGAPEEAGGMDLVVNATSAGMAGSRGAGESPPVGPELLGSGQVVVDLIYQPPVTSWLEAASGRGATVVGGLGMLVHQAAGQLRTWTGFEAPLTEMWRAVQDAVGP